MKAFFKVPVPLVLVILLGLTKYSHSQGPFDPRRDARRDLRAAKVQAVLEHKKILLDFGANWCGPCVTLDDLFASDREIHRSLKGGFVLVKVPVEIDKDSVATQAIRKQYPKFAVVPHLLILDTQGRQLWHQPNEPLLSDLKKGLWNPQAVLLFLQRWESRQATPTSIRGKVVGDSARRR